MAELKWKLKEFMDEQGIAPLEIEREAIRLGYDIGKNVIYRLATVEGPQRFDRGSLVAIISALRSLTSRPIKIADLLEYVPDEV